MKFRENDKIEFELLELTEKDIHNKMNIIKDYKLKKLPLDKENYIDGINKWSLSTPNKRFKKSIEKTLVELEAGNFEYDVLTRSLIGLSTIETHLNIELEYYERNINKMIDFISFYFKYLNDVQDIKSDVLKGLFGNEIPIDTIEKLKRIFKFFLN
jgi:hypothetical protein